MNPRVSLCFLFISTLFLSCANDYSPKPRAYYRINFPEKKYQAYLGECPYSFDFPIYAKIEPDSSAGAKPCWLNIHFSQFNGRVHLSYHSFSSKTELNQLTEDSRTFAFKHTPKATAIDEGIISYPEQQVYGVYYSISGNTASSVQFFLTDSTNNYLRGALYFNEVPRIDSIQPVLDFVKEDIDLMIKSFKWKKP